jgi:hypothetical protein
MRQDATGSERGMGAGILKGKHQAYGTTTYASRCVHFRTNEKNDGVFDELQRWHDLCKPLLHEAMRDSLTSTMHGSVTTSLYSLATGTAHVLYSDYLS